MFSLKSLLDVADLCRLLGEYDLRIIRRPNRGQFKYKVSLTAIHLLIEKSRNQKEEENLTETFP